MSTTPGSAGTRIRQAWDKTRVLPGGRILFSALFSRLVPYSGTIRPLILELGPGRCRAQLRDRRGVRNHLHSVHAVALMNLGEMASGLALVYGLPDDARAILIGLSMEYLKKARGTLIAEAAFEVPSVVARQELELSVLIRDQADDVVARAQARWLVDRRA